MVGTHARKMSVITLVFLCITVLVGSIVLLDPQYTQAQSKEDLEQQLQDIENQIAEYQQELKETVSEKKTLQSRIYSLGREQQQYALQIEATNLRIDTLDQNLLDTKLSIIELEEKIASTRKSIALIIRELHKRDSVSWLEVIAVNDKISDFFLEVFTFESLLSSLEGLRNESVALKADLETQRSYIVEQREDSVNLLSIKALQEQELGATISTQRGLLASVKGVEATHVANIAESKKRAEQIRGRIYALLGGGTQPTFGEAVEIAKWVSQQTGVRPALLLAVLSQESNLGKNVGTCNRPGDPPSKSWKEIMKPTRDQEPFLVITKELGRDPDTTPVSCPMRDKNGELIGWGGAMGPAQFIPSTWMSYKGKVAGVTGQAADPWDIRDAFVAAALLLRDNGATKSGANAEWAAAMRYFSGSTNPRFSFYGDNVLKRAAGYQEDIDALSL